MKKVILFIVFVISLSCSNEKEPIKENLLFFQFLPSDNEHFIEGYDDNEVITYSNQKNEEIKFKVLISRKSKQLYSRGSWVYGSTKYFYYDEQRIEMGDISEVPIQYNQDNKFYISIKRWPVNFNDGSNSYPFVLSQESRLTINIGLVPFNTGIQSILLDYSGTLQNLTIKEKTYINVRKIVIPPNPYPNLNWIPQSLNFIYFDQNNGVIGFDDIQNNEWRLQS